MSLLLNSTQLERMRQVEERSMPGTAIIQRNVETATGMGGMAQSWQNVGTVPCDAWPTPMRGRENVTGGQVTSHLAWFVSVPYGTDVWAKDRLTIANRTFEVVAVPNDATWQTNLRLECKTFNEEKRSDT